MSYDLSKWSMKELLNEYEKAMDDLRDDREYQDGLPSGARDYSVLEADRQWIERLKDEIDRRSQK